MFIDASALTAILLEEEDSLALLERLQAVSVRLTSPLAVWETSVAVARVLGLPIGEAAMSVDNYLELAEIVVSPVAPRTATIALDAFARYGKGHHPAKLNFGDCFAYACARNLGQPLLFKGEDFAKTDIETA